jgi:hypothetical protein
MLPVDGNPCFYMSFKTFEFPNNVMLNARFREIEWVLPYFNNDGVEIKFK